MGEQVKILVGAGENTLGGAGKLMERPPSHLAQSVWRPRVEQRLPSKPEKGKTSSKAKARSKTSKAHQQGSSNPIKGLEQRRTKTLDQRNKRDHCRDTCVMAFAFHLMN